ncbi:GHMP kinase [Geomonas limicola]|uniref:GHMP kinase n=1 Tax=Geomonas limicola TaxID=2740186 RepID=A0A6V8N9F7_9BACT|nr:kinase [Geomonas limicola]GFO68524.1 GHMP kinase [Geomonas limicola]
MIISRTPYRISFFGGGTDYPAWYLKHGGSVLATTIDKYCYITCRYLPPFFEHKHRIVYSNIESCKHLDEIQHPAFREVLRFMEIDRGVEVHHDGDLPARSGMGSSSAFTVGLLNALYALKGVMATKQELAMKSIHIEQNMIRETVGSQDQTLAAYGGFNLIQFQPNREISVRPVITTPERVRELNSHLMLFYTGIKRTAASVADSYVHDLEGRKRQLRIMKDLVDEGLSVLNSHHDIEGFGELMHEAWLSKRSMSSSVSNSEVDGLYEAARRAGAVGGKITGAGGGGFLLLFAPPELHQKIKEALNTLIHVPFSFDYTGSQIIYFQHEEDFSHAEQVRGGQVIAPFRELSHAGFPDKPQRAVAASA